MTEKTESLDTISLVAHIVACYVSKNNLPTSELPGFIQQIHRSLCEVGSTNPYIHEGRSEPIVPVQNSVHPDYIVCLEDGRRLKMLKRYLKTTYNMTPNQYRERWGLDPDYPMVAPNYAKRRSHLAKDFGLGKGRVKKTKTSH